MSALTAVLFRNCPHDTNVTSESKVRFVLQCDNFAVQVARTPIQMPIPGQSPRLMDFGIFRPSISISGLVETQGGDAAYNPSGFTNQQIPAADYYAYLSYVPYGRRVNSNTTVSLNYFLPNKNILEEAAYKWKTLPGAELELEIADAEIPRLNTYTGGTAIAGGSIGEDVKPTGGGVYKVSIQQARFQVDAAKEDRWTFQMQFVAMGRQDISGIGN